MSYKLAVKASSGNPDERNRYLTLGIDFTDLKCLIVGGGRIGTHKALILSEHGAKVTVCSPRISQTIRAAVEQGRMTWNLRHYRPAFLRGVQFVVAATDDIALNQQIAEDAQGRGIAYCIVSAGTQSRVIFPAVHQSGQITVAVHSNGQSPRRSVTVRNHLARLLESHPLPCEEPVVRSDSDNAEQGHSGKVYIIGAGPGAADLITVRGLRAIHSAHLVIYDRILGADFAEQIGIDPLNSEIEWLGAGRMGPRRQAEINRHMLKAARAGKTIARVKNGDPFIFGRGTEEIDFLTRHGIPCKIVPGVSSALGVLSAAGYALTTRQKGRSFAVTSAQLADGEFNEHYPKTDSLVVLMTVSMLERVTDHLLSDDWLPETPALIIERGTQAGEKEVSGPLQEIAQLSRHHNMESPAILAIGFVAAHKYASSAKPDAELSAIDEVDNRIIQPVLSNHPQWSAPQHRSKI